MTQSVDTCSLHTWSMGNTWAGVGQQRAPLGSSEATGLPRIHDRHHPTLLAGTSLLDHREDPAASGHGFWPNGPTADSPVESETHDSKY